MYIPRSEHGIPVWKHGPQAPCLHVGWVKASTNRCSSLHPPPPHHAHPGAPSSLKSQNSHTRLPLILSRYPWSMYNMENSKGLSCALQRHASLFLKYHTKDGKQHYRNLAEARPDAWKQKNGIPCHAWALVTLARVSDTNPMICNITRYQPGAIGTATCIESCLTVRISAGSKYIHTLAPKLYCLKHTKTSYVTILPPTCSWHENAMASLRAQVASSSPQLGTTQLSRRHLLTSC